MSEIIAADRQAVLPSGYEDCVWRPITRGDMAALAELAYLDDMAAGIANYRMSEDEMLAEYYDGHYDVESSTRVLLTPQGALIARVDIYDRGSPPVRNNISIAVHPDHAGRGLEEMCVRWGIGRVSQAIARCPEDARVVVQTWVPETYTARKAVYEAMNFRPVRHFFRMKIDMSAAPDVPTLAEGFTLRTMRLPDDIEPYMHARLDAWRDHWGYVEQPFSLALEQFHAWIDHDTKWTPERCFLIIDDAMQEIAAFCNTRIEEWGDPTVAYVATLATRRAYRRRGFANFLLRHTFRCYWDMGRPSVALHVDAGSLTGALKLYEDAGMHTDMIETTYEYELRPGRDLTLRAIV